MTFIARISIPPTQDCQDRSMPVRAYLHSSGIEAYDGGFEQRTGRKKNEFELAYSSASYLGEQVLGHAARPGYGQLFKPAKYLLVALFGKGDAKMAEVFGYGDFEEWPGNPTKYRWTFENNVYRPNIPEDGCEDMDIVLGIEGKHRREIPDLDTFMNKPPRVDELLIGNDYKAIISGGGGMHSMTLLH